MEKKVFSSASSQNSKNITSNQAANGTLTVDQLDIEILPIIYEIIRWWIATWNFFLRIIVLSSFSVESFLTVIIVFFLFIICQLRKRSDWQRGQTARITRLQSKGNMFQHIIFSFVINRIFETSITTSFVQHFTGDWIAASVRQRSSSNQSTARYQL